MQLAVIWPLSRNHFLTIHELALLPPIKAPEPRVGASDYRVIIKSVVESWMSMREVTKSIPGADLANYLARGVGTRLSRLSTR